MPDAIHRCKVLVIDDDRDAQEMLRVALTADGYQVATAGNGRDALVHLRSTADTCILVLDLGLPHMDGALFRAAQLRDRALAWIPIVVMSGSVDGAARARELGARSFIAKPADLDRLRAALRRIGCCKAKPRPEQRSETAELARRPPPS
jgi:DNA-binding NtrC family response regulator